MRILCCGDRYYKQEHVIYSRLSQYRGTDTVIIHGNANGADRLSALVACNLGLSIISFPAKWKLYGRAAGPIRNQQMIDEGKPDLVIAFHDNIESSKGTKDMLNRAKKHNIPTELISST